MNPTTPRVTVIMATWNWSSVLPFSTKSVLQQTYSDFELLVIGDACTDDSELVIGAIDDPRIRWMNLPENYGHQTGPNNEGLRQARGEIIAYLGHDDLWLPHHLAELIATIDTGADVAWGITRMVAPTRPDLDGVHAIETFRSGVWLPPSSVVHRKAITDHAGGWRHYRDLDIDPDTEVWSRLAAAGAQMVGVPRLTVVKFPAATRENVYREKPCREQAEWLARIEAEPDFELIELSRSLMRAKAIPSMKPYGALLKEVVERAWRGTIRRLPFRNPQGRQQEFFKQRLRFKGVALHSKRCKEGTR